MKVKWEIKLTNQNRHTQGHCGKVCTWLVSLISGLSSWDKQLEITCLDGIIGHASCEMSCDENIGQWMLVWCNWFSHWFYGTRHNKGNNNSVCHFSFSENRLAYSLNFTFIPLPVNRKSVPVKREKLMMSKGKMAVHKATTYIYQLSRLHCGIKNLCSWMFATILRHWRKECHTPTKSPVECVEWSGKLRTHGKLVRR